jgi:hypothetical protein
MSFPILQRIIALLGVQSSRPITYRKPSAVTRKPSLEKYDFEDSGQLRELIAEIQRGELPQPRRAEWEPDFGAWGPSETAARLKERMGLKPPAGVGPISQPVVSKRSLHDSLIAEPMPSALPIYEKPPYDFGSYGAGPTQSLIANRPILTPEEKALAFQECLKGPDFGTYDLRPTRREPSPYKTREEMLYGPNGKPQRTFEPTIKSSINLKKSERYDFGISF